MEEMSSTDSRNGDEVEVVEKGGYEPNECAICNENLPNGTIICDSCSENSGNVKTVMTYVKKIRLRCLFEEYGCKEMVQYGELAKHEAMCQFKPINCFISDGFCAWKGQQKDVMTHVSQNHPHNIIKNGELTLSLKSKGEENVVVFEKNDVVTALFYNYNNQTKVFGYCIRYFCNSGVDKVHRITISNRRNENNHYILVQNKIHKPYTDETSLIKNEMILNLNHILSYLDNADLILISTEIITALEYEKLKCNDCFVYVTFPAYKTLDNELVCSDCAAKDSSNLELVEDKSLKEIASKLTYPCRWKYCTHVDTYDKIRGHEKECTYREIVCPIQDCYEIFDMSNTRTHFQTTHENIKFRVSLLLNLQSYAPVNYPTGQTILVNRKINEVVLVTYTFDAAGVSYTKFPQCATSKVFGILGSECCEDVALKFSNKMQLINFSVYCCHNAPLSYLRFTIEE